MSKYGEFFAELGFGLLCLYLMYIALFFFGGHYTNNKIECIKKHESVEARYNIITGCWYWDEITSKMVKDKNAPRKDTAQVIIKKIGDTVNGEQVYTSSDGRKFREIDEEKEKRDKKLWEQFMKGTV